MNSAPAIGAHVSCSFPPAFPPALPSFPVTLSLSVKRITAPDLRLHGARPWTHVYRFTPMSATRLVGTPPQRSHACTAASAASRRAVRRQKLRRVVYRFCASHLVLLTSSRTQHTLFILTPLTWPYLSTSSLTRDWFSRAKAVEIAWFRLVGFPGRGLRSLSCSVSDTERSQYRTIATCLSQILTCSSNRARESQ